MQTLKQYLNKQARDYIVKILIKNKGHVTRAAKVLGRNRTQLYKLLKQLKIVVWYSPGFGETYPKPEGTIIVWRTRAAKRSRNANRPTN